MTTANTLTTLRACQLDVTVFFFPNAGVTVAIQSPDEGFNISRYAVALMSPEDIENGVSFDHTQGELLVRQRIARCESNIANIFNTPGALMWFATNVAQITCGNQVI